MRFDFNASDRQIIVLKIVGSDIVIQTTDAILSRPKSLIVQVPIRSVKPTQKKTFPERLQKAVLESHFLLDFAV
jgi:hypothetical protein